MSDELRTRGHIPWRKVDLRLRTLREIWMATSDARGRTDWEFPRELIAV